ncbi:MAG TPA: cyclase family protein [Ktedonobacterales bacterium]|nr:cyclase family protein [Ktedonobacterales bacterium]
MTNDQHSQRRVQFDFEVTFSNGGSLRGEGFRLDIPGDDITDNELADYLIRDLRLLMARDVRIRNKRIIVEPHKRGLVATDAATLTTTTTQRHIDLSHTVEDGMITYKGLPAPIICDFLSREQSRASYAEGTEFQIGKIELVANTGTYLDSPFHRYADGHDLSELDLARLANLEAVLIRVTGSAERAISHTTFGAVDVRGRAVLAHTGWDRHWRTDQYFEGHPFLTEDAANYLRDAGAALVGIDSYNIDDTADLRRPAHSILLGAEIPIVEHLCGLEQLPTAGFRFTAVPVKVRGMGTFPVRAYATLAEGDHP